MDQGGYWGWGVGGVNCQDSEREREYCKERVQKLRGNQEGVMGTPFEVVGETGEVGSGAYRKIRVNETSKLRESGSGRSSDYKNGDGSSTGPR